MYRFLLAAMVVGFGLVAIAALVLGLADPSIYTLCGTIFYHGTHDRLKVAVCCLWVILGLMCLWAIDRSFRA